MKHLNKTLEDFKEFNAEQGQYFFSEDTLRFFGSEMETDLMGPNNDLFITSEDNFDKTERLYTVRRANWETGSVATVQKFQGFSALDDAMELVEQETQLEQENIEADAEQDKKRIED